jgi:hypothetical protein
MQTYEARLVETVQTARNHVQIWRQGRERQPVLVIDDYLADPEAMRAVAIDGPAFEPLGPYYPGIRSPFPDDQLDLLLSPLGPLLPRYFGYEGPAGLRECSFSLITTKPADLMPIQRLPHFDSLEYGRLAALLFLGKGENGGTAFYRQRSTGFETVDAGRFAQYEATLNDDVAIHGLPQLDYIGDDSPLYETIGLHQGIYNRMIVYASATLHSGRIPPDFAFDPDPSQGRLTVNAFLGPD